MAAAAAAGPGAGAAEDAFLTFYNEVPPVPPPPRGLRAVRSRALPGSGAAGGRDGRSRYRRWAGSGRVTNAGGFVLGPALPQPYWCLGSGPRVRCWLRSAEPGGSCALTVPARVAPARPCCGQTVSEARPGPGPRSARPAPAVGTRPERVS